MPTTNINLDFPDDRTQNDFEIAFRGWLKQYQQQAGLARAVAGGGSAQPSSSASGSTGGLTGGASGSHSYGGGAGGAQQGSTGGLLSIGGASGQVGPYGGSVKDFYLNFIGGW